MDFPVALIDTNGRTAIAALHPQDEDTVRLVRMDQDPLTILFTSGKGVEQMGFKPIGGYAIERAAEKFLRHKAGVSFAARQMLESLIPERVTQYQRPTPAAGPTEQQEPTEIHNMSIEQTLERLAIAQEKTAEHLSGVLQALLARNELLATTGAQLVQATAPAAEGDKSKRTRRTREQIAADEAAAAEKQAAPGESTSAAGVGEAAGTAKSESSDAATAQPASAAPAENDDDFGDDGFTEPVQVVQRTKEEIQKLFGSISQTGDANKKAAIETMKGFADPGVIKNISTIPDDKINAVYDALADMLATVKAAA